MKQFKKVLVANRGEIAIRVFRALNELGIVTVSIYSKEDRYALFRSKADESYPLNPDKGPIDAYLDIDTIIKIALNAGVDAIHPGYGFLSENPEFVDACEQNGITFIGPSSDIMRAMGDKISSKQIAIAADVYNGAYERMRQTIEGYLAEYPSIQMVLDIHRDAAEDADGNPVALTAEADGEACAELMLVVGTDEGGLSHPDWQENLANALKIQTLLNRSAPGLCRNLNLRTERFNQHETPGSLLVEVGASGNTLAEALRSARILGQALAVFLRGQMHDDTD